MSGIGIVNCLYFHPKIERFWIIDYRIYNPENDEKSKIDNVEFEVGWYGGKSENTSQNSINGFGYATQRLMALIDNLGKIYYCPLKSNRLVDDSGGVKKYQKLEELKWNEWELTSGKIIKIKGFPRDKKVKLFWGSVSTNFSRIYCY